MTGQVPRLTAPWDHFVYRPRFHDGKRGGLETKQGTSWKHIASGCFKIPDSRLKMFAVWPRVTLKYSVPSRKSNTKGRHCCQKGIGQLCL